MDGEPISDFGAQQFVPDPAMLKKAGRFGCIFGSLVLIAVIVMALLGPYVEYEWFVHDARHPEVFGVMLNTKGWLFLGSFLVGWAILGINLRRALSISLVFLRKPENFGQVLISNAMGFVQTQGGTIVKFLSPVIAFVLATGFSEGWNTLLLAQHGTRFGVTDPTFGLDLGFFVFTLPWYEAVVGYVLNLLLLTTVLSIGIYTGLQALASLAKIELGRPAVKGHITILLFLTLGVLGLQTWLGTYSIGLVPSSQFMGGGYSAMQAMQAQRILAVLLVVTGVGAVINHWVGRAYWAVTRGGAICFACYALGVIVIPAITQQLIVHPNQVARETPFAARALKMTRFAYGLDKIEVRDVTSGQEPTKDEVAASQVTLDNMRLWDPLIMGVCLDGLQSIKSFYRFDDVDIDRYMINGKQTMLMLAPRDLDINGLEASAQNWTNQRLRYTHGYGVVVAKVNQATEDGKPVLMASDIPQQADPELPKFEPRLYFMNTLDKEGFIEDQYAIVDTDQPEYDHPSMDNSAMHRWQGARGIPVGSLLNRLAFSVALGDGNLLISPNIGSNSRMLMHRNVLERAGKIYPFLHFDKDPYIVLLGGHVVWVLDAYTTSNQVPYSSRTSVGNYDVNYIRNSVKVTLDAYSGESVAYAVEPDEPILKAYRSIYPNLVHDASEMPKGLREHFRYPDDMLNVQCNQFASYHVTDPVVFLTNSDAWDVSYQKGTQMNREPMKPFFVQMKLPDEQEPGFMQILPFSPRQKINMSGWLAAHCDPKSYGKVVLYRFTQGNPIAGPEQIEAGFNTTPEIANMNKLFTSEQSKPLVGNLLVIPIGKSVMYLESLYLKSNTTGLAGVPRLTRVILGLNSRVVVADTYQHALTQLFGDQANTPEPTPAAKPGMANSPQVSSPTLEAVKSAVKQLDDAEAALRKGDFATYGKLQQEARERLRKLAQGRG